MYHFFITKRTTVCSKVTVVGGWVGGGLVLRNLAIIILCEFFLCHMFLLDYNHSLRAWCSAKNGCSKKSIIIMIFII